MTMHQAQTAAPAIDDGASAATPPTVATREPSPSGLGPSGECQLAGHTPLPWVIGNRYGIRKTEVLSADRSRVIAAVWTHEPSALPGDIGFVPSPQGMADAQLIVRACNSHDELVEALRKSVLALDEAAALLTAKGLQGCGSIMSGHADIARAAIASATGAA